MEIRLTALAGGDRLAERRGLLPVTVLGRRWRPRYAGRGNDECSSRTPAQGEKGLNSPRPTYTSGRTENDM
jgi:hypothetical protein